MSIMVYQVRRKLTDAEVREELASNLFLQTALGLDPTSDKTIIAERTIWSARDRIVKNDLTEAVFGELLGGLIKEYNPDCSIVRGDGAHLDPNMKKMGRLELCFHTIRRFLLEFSKSGSYLWKNIPVELQIKYGIEKESVNAFSQSKKQDRADYMNKMALDLSFLTDYLATKWSVNWMESWRKVERVFRDQCELVEGELVKVWGVKTPLARLKPGSKVLATAPQSPSDGEATYSRHKGSGYTGYVPENVFPLPENGEVRGIMLILCWGVKPANEHESAFFLEALAAFSGMNLEVKDFLCDGAFSSSDNYLRAAEFGINLVSPANGSTPGGRGFGRQTFQILAGQVQIW
jgi:hypothetical protein